MNKIIEIIQSDEFLLWVTVFLCAYVAHFFLGVYLGGKYQGFSWKRFWSGIAKGFVLVIAIALLMFIGLLIPEVSLEGLGTISITFTMIAIVAAAATKYIALALQKFAFILEVKLPEKYQLVYEPQITESQMIDGCGIQVGTRE